MCIVLGLNEVQYKAIQCFRSTALLWCRVDCVYVGISYVAYLHNSTTNLCLTVGH